MVNQVGTPTILVRGGTYFDYEHPEQSQFTIEDIAHALSHVCRFGGHTPYHYSVAQHSVYVSQLVPERHQLAALLHDAAEAFIGDMPRPLKRLMPEFKAMEKRIEVAIFRHFGLPVTSIFQIGIPLQCEVKMAPCIKDADNAMLRAEQVQLMANNDGWTDTHNVEAAPILIERWAPDRAKMEFLSRFHELEAANV